MQTFLHGVTVGQPLWLCEDVRRCIHAFEDCASCRLCGRIVEHKRGPTRRVQLCFTRDGLLCFTCWHRLRWPRA